MQGSKQKIGVGRKITYDIQIEDSLLTFALAEREKESGLTFKKLKEKAIELISTSNSSQKNLFRGSQSWAKKFCKRNLVDIKDQWKPPKFFPRSLFGTTKEFVSDAIKRAKEYPKELVIFMDEVKYNLGVLRNSKGEKNEKYASLYVSISQNGLMIMPPLIQYSLSVHVDKKVDSQGDDVSIHSDNEEFTMLKWIELCLLPYTKGRPALLIMDAHGGKDFYSPIILKHIARRKSLKN